MISDKLKKLRIQKGVSQQDMANLLDVSRQVYNNYELGKRNPDIEMIKRLAKTFDVSIDYLLDNAIEKEEIWFLDEEKNEKVMLLRFSKRLGEIMIQKDLNQKELANIVKTTPATISRYLNNERNPNIDFLNNMSEAFNMSIDYILGRTDDSEINNNKNNNPKEDEKKEPPNPQKVAEALRNVLELGGYDPDNLTDEQTKYLLNKLISANKKIKKERS